MILELLNLAQQLFSDPAKQSTLFQLRKMVFNLEVTIPSILALPEGHCSAKPTGIHHLHRI